MRRRRPVAALWARVLAGLLAGAAGAPAANAAPGAVTVPVGRRSAREALGFGWGGPEDNGQENFAWIRRHEADVWLALDAPPGAARLELRAVPFFVPRYQQVIGLFVNGHYVTEWTCPRDNRWRFETYATDLPSGLLHGGRNRITLRVGYVVGGPGRKDYALAVESLRLAW